MKNLPPSPFSSFADVILALGNSGAFGQAIGVGIVTASAMKVRGSIPASYWPRVIAAAEAQGIEGITYELLARLAAERKGRDGVHRDHPSAARARTSSRIGGAA